MDKTTTVAKYEYDKTTDLLFIGDTHYGVKGSLLPKLDEYLTKYDTESKLVILGDMIDNSLLNSVGDIYEQIKNPNDSFKFLNDFFKRHKSRILVILSGNHEYRTKRVAGVDVVELLAGNLNIPYSRTDAILDVSVKATTRYGSRDRYNYCFALHHGAAGGRYPEKSARQGRWFQDKITGVDAYVMGHTHSANVTPIAQEFYDRRNKSVFKRTLYYITIGPFVSDEYAERKMLRPPAYNLIRVKCYGGKKRQLRITLDEFDENLRSTYI